MKRLTAAGQIKCGDEIHCEYKGKLKKYTAIEVLNPGSDREEIVVNKKANIYFITSMAIDGTSWAKNVKFHR